MVRPSSIRKVARLTRLAFDFFTVSLTATEIAEAFDKNVAEVTWVCHPTPFNPFGKTSG